MFIATASFGILEEMKKSVPQVIKNKPTQNLDSCLIPRWEFQSESYLEWQIFYLRNPKPLCFVCKE